MRARVGSVTMISFDLPETLSLTDRLLVFHEGMPARQHFTTAKTTPEEIFPCAAGIATSSKGAHPMSDKKTTQAREKP